MQVLLQFIVPPILLAVSFLLRPFAGKSARLRVAWAFLSLWLAPFVVSFLPATWIPGLDAVVNIAHTLLALAAIQLAAIAVFEILLRRFSLNKLMVDGIVGMASAMVLANLLYRLGVSPTGILVTFALTGAIIAFGLQDMLSSVVGGIVMDLNRGIRVGDYILCGEFSGWVETMSLRQTTIKDLDGDLIVIPNSQLYRAPVRIFASLRRRFVTFIMPYGTDSQEVIETVDFAMLASPMEGIAVDPPPSCSIQEMSVAGVTFCITIWVTGPGNHNAEASTALTRVGFALERAGLPFGDFPNVIEVKPEHERRKQALTPIEVLRRAPILRLLDTDDLTRLAAGIQRQTFAPGEVIVRQGEPGESMYFIGKGKISVLHDAGDGVQRQVALMAGGDFFGEVSLLTGESRSATVQAVSRVDCYQLKKEGMHYFIHSRNDLIEDIASVMAARQMELKQLRQKVDEETAQAREAEARQEFLTSLQRFFGVSPDRKSNPTPPHPASPPANSQLPPATRPEAPPVPASKAPSALETQVLQMARMPGPARTETVRRDAITPAEATRARERASRLMNEGKYSEALNALEEADEIEGDPRERGLRTAVRPAVDIANPRRTGTVDQAVKIVDRYSKIAAGAGLIPGAVINFAAILAVQVRMVWKLARLFGQRERVERIRGSIMSLLTSAIPAVVGHGTALAVTATAVVAGSVLYFLFTPVLAYAVTQAVGRTFVMHFESGRTLLTFNAIAFQDYFLTEFHRAYGKKSTSRQKTAA